MSLANTYKGVDSEGQLSLSAISTPDVDQIVSLREILVEGGGDTPDPSEAEPYFTVFPKNVQWTWNQKNASHVVVVESTNEVGVEWDRDGVLVPSLNNLKTFDPATLPDRGVGEWRCWLLNGSGRYISKKFYIEERYEQYSNASPVFPEIFSNTNGTDYIQLQLSDGVASALSANGTDPTPLFTDTPLNFPQKVFTPSDGEDSSFTSNNPLTFDFYVSSGTDILPAGSNSDYNMVTESGVSFIEGGKFALDMTSSTTGRSYEIYFLQDLPSGGKLQVFNMFATWFRS